MQFLYFSCFVLMAHCAYGAVSTLQPPTIIHTLNSTDLGPEFLPVNETSETPTTTTAPVVQPALGNRESRVKDEENDSEKPIEDAKFWYNVARKQLEKTIKIAKKNQENAFKRKAKNVIIFVGDGMGLTTITAGRIYKGQLLKHGNGEEEKLSFDEFPYTGLAKTYNVDKQVPDSAGTATAMFCGAKTDSGAIGVDSTRSKIDAKQGRLTSIMDWAQAEGKRTGIVTTTRITHATPAATYARIYHRDWECDTEVPTESKGIHTDIARQLIESAPGNKFNVIMGGGLKPMGATNINEVRSTEWQGGTEKICSRGDSLNLAQKWLENGKAMNEKREFVRNLKELDDLDLKEVDRLLGLFRNNHITYAIAKEEGEPSLKEMTEAAIEVLQREDSNGFVLLVEGGRIDQAHHQNYAHAALQEVYEFDQAIEAALENTNANETLIIVTADHSHSVTLNGYPKRGNDILGFASKSTDPMAYETIMYANGPGFYDHVSNDTNAVAQNPLSFWKNLTTLTAEQRQSPTYRHMATVPLKDESHGGEDVVVFANGPGSSLVRGVFEQNYLAYVMSYAGCMGPAKDFDETCRRSSSAVVAAMPLVIILAVCLVNLFK
ncbi:alkaline phosphatase 4 [Musca autumnalis]|uniref:alkaline phosphatase 4 n=1 Tax=Musca autumnalis TaxID=221902 RepID=UPI003CFA5CCD